MASGVSTVYMFLSALALFCVSRTAILHASFGLSKGGSWFVRSSRVWNVTGCLCGASQRARATCSQDRCPDVVLHFVATSWPTQLPGFAQMDEELLLERLDNAVLLLEYAIRHIAVEVSCQSMVDYIWV